MLLAAAFFVIAAAVGWACTGVVRRYALSRAVLDVPNERSSHTVPTPRGGGLAIAVVLVAGTLVVHGLAWLDLRTTLAITGGAALIAGVGWIDDRRDVPARWRFLVQCSAAAWALVWLGGWPQIDVGVARMSLGPVGALLGVFWIVWLTNLYNFMDGIDGLAASQAGLIALVGGGLLLAGGSASLGALAWAVAGASLGFLAWNWPPARIFMGDVGSGLLGFFFATLALASERAGAVPVLLWALLLGVFVFDASLTLVRRWYHGKRWYEGHREHAYQRAVQAGFSHRRVTTTAACLTAVLALAAVHGWNQREMILVWLVVASSLLGAAYLWVERIEPMSGRCALGSGSNRAEGKGRSAVPGEAGARSSGS